MSTSRQFNKQIAFTGNVGVGTTSPATQLHINGLTYINDNLIGAPTNSTYGSAGTKLTLWNGGSLTPYSLGINTTTMWYGVPTGASHVWYYNTTPQAQLLNGAFTCTGDITAFGSVSDRRLKTDINRLSPSISLETVNALSPVSFKWKENVFNKEKRGKEDVGFIAQEVEEVIQYAVTDFSMQDTPTYKGIKHERLIPYLVGAVQELSATVTDLSNQLMNLREKLEKMRNKIN